MNYKILEGFKEEIENIKEVMDESYIEKSLDFNYMLKISQYVDDVISKYFLAIEINRYSELEKIS